MTKTYGQTATFAGTAFTTSGLVNSDTVTSVSLSSTGAAATATVSGSPYAIVASAAVGSGLSELHDQLRQRQPDGQPGAADDHRQQHDQDLRADGDVRRHRVHHQRPGQQRHGHQREPEQHGRGGHRAGEWLALCDRRVERRRLRPGQLHDHLRQRQPHGDPAVTAITTTPSTTAVTLVHPQSLGRTRR